MYTQCPECLTFFRVTASQLSVANGEVCCGACSTEFNALASLSDEVPDGIDDPRRDEIPGDTEDNHRRDDEVLDQLLDDNDRGEVLDRTIEDHDRGEVLDQLLDDNDRGKVLDQILDDNDRGDEIPDDHEDADWGKDDDDDRDEVAADDPIEFPSQLTGNFELRELTRDPLTGNLDSAIPEDDASGDEDEDAIPEDDDDEPEYEIPADDGYRQHEIPSEPDDDDWTVESTDEPNAGPGADAYDIEGNPPWLGGEAEPAAVTTIISQKNSPLLIVAAALLGFTLLAQILHHDRDALAVHPRYGGMVRAIYDRIGSTIYPEWRLSSFEVRGTEAVASGGSTSALNILANVLIVSQQPVGMPLIRVVLRDRWSDPVASGVFQPHEYLGDKLEPTQILPPGTTLPIEIVVADPGDEARGYVVDVCLPRRTTGLQCQLSKDPFR